MTEFRVNDFAAKDFLTGKEFDFYSYFRSDYPGVKSKSELKQRIQEKISRDNIANSAIGIMERAGGNYQDAKNCIIVYLAFRWEISRESTVYRFWYSQKEKTVQQAQELAEKISHDFGFDKCPIRIDRFEADPYWPPDCARAFDLDVVFLLRAENDRV